MWLCMMGLSWAGAPLDRPPQPVTSVDECTQSTALVLGQPVPAELLADGVLKCSAVAEPTSSLTYLLAIERYSTAADELHASQLMRLQLERDWYKAKAQLELQPQPWIERPGTQRWLGRLEMLAVVAIVGGGTYAATHKWGIK